MILQLRELDVAADDEFEAFLRYGGLGKPEVKRVRMELESFSGLDPRDFSGVLVGGGPSNVSDHMEQKPGYQLRFEKELDELLDKIFEYDTPYLGSCYGLGAMMKHAGGVISKENYSEPVGFVEVTLTEEGKNDPLLQDVDSRFEALCGHKEACQDLPDDIELLGSSSTCPIQLVRYKKNVYATQFHCELDSSGIAVRIKAYKNHGYFKPEEASQLIERTKNVVAHVPQTILRRWVDKYRD